MVGKLACLVVDGLACVVEGRAAHGPREVAAGVMVVGLEERLVDLEVEETHLAYEDK